MKYRAGLVTLLLFAQFFSCGRKELVKGLSAADFGISAYTSGLISRQSTIRVQFFDPVNIDSSKYQISVEPSPFSFTPNIKGTAVWIDNHTIEFRPSEKLEGGKTYKAALKVSFFKKLLKKRNEEFLFDFTAIKQTFEIKINGLAPIDLKDLKWQKFTGDLLTADVEDNALVEKIIHAKQNGKELKILWQHSTDGHDHQFTVDSLYRSEDSSQAFLLWNGKPIDVINNEGKQTIEIPSINTFTVLHARPIQDNQSCLEIRFSDLLEKTQDLNGLIRIDSKNDLRFTIEKNIVLVYSSSGWNGAFKINVEPGIENSMGRKLKKGWSGDVIFEELKPQVRFTGKGVIVPTSQGLTVPIEAVNLRAVTVKAYRIYESNVPQFLQNNDLAGDNELKRVGRVIWKKTVDLDPAGAKKNQWVHYGLDMTQLVSDNPGGIYRLELSFKRNMIICDCADTLQSSQETNWKEENIEAENQDNPDEEVESSYWDNYGNSEEINWNEYYSQKENPCHPAYYISLSGHDIRARRNILISDIGMIAKKGTGDTINCILTDLKTAKPLTGAAVKLLDYQQQALNSGNTDNQGMVSLSFSRTPYLVIASNGNQKGYLRVDNGSALSVSYFDVSGETVEKGIKGCIYGERGVWRPGDTLFLTFVLYDPQRRVPADHPVTLDLFNSRGQLVRSMRALESVDGFYGFKVPTNESDPTGNWTAKVRAGGVVFERQLKVETIMPNRLRIKLDFENKILTSEDGIYGTLFAQWLHGGTAGGLNATVDLTLTKATTSFKGYNNYSFDDPVRNYEPENFNIFEGALDDQGKAQISTSIDAKNVAPGMLNANFKTRVFEPGGTFSIDRFTLPFSPYKQYVGLKVPEGDKARGMLLTDTTHSVSIAAVNSDGTPVSKARVEVKMYKVEWRWWWEKGGNESLADYVNSSSYSPIKSDTVNVTNGRGQWDFRHKLSRMGTIFDKNDGSGRRSQHWIDSLC